MKQTRVLAYAMILMLSFNITVACDDSKSADEWYVMGMSETDCEKKIEYFTRVLELEPDRVFVYTERTMAYVDLGLYDEALADFTSNIDLDPEDNQSLKLGGEVYHLIGDNIRALEDIGRALDIEPEYAGAYEIRADIYRELGRYDEALADVESAMWYSPGTQSYFYTRGLIYRDMGEVEKIIADMMLVCQGLPNVDGACEACAYLGAACDDGVVAACIALENLE